MTRRRDPIDQFSNFLYALGKTTRDVQAVRKGRVLRRIARRIVGRWIGRNVMRRF